MEEMTSRERVLRTFEFEETDRPPFDLMESIVWPELQAWFSEELGLHDKDAVLDRLGVDFRWYWPNPTPPEGVELFPYYMMPWTGSYSDHIEARPLANVHTVEEMVRRHGWMEPEWFDMSGVHPVRAAHPDKAIVTLVHTTMMFMSLCDFFGIEEALMRLLTEDAVLTEFQERQADYARRLLRHACKGAGNSADIFWLMDDIATQRGLMMRPDLWRRHFKRHLRDQVEIVHEHGMRVLFHSCGSVRSILPDLIEVGVDGVLPFQTNSEGMSVESIARDFGGRMVFYGGMDVQQLLTFGTEEEVRRQVRHNCDCFSRTGGHIVANSHHCVENISPRNVWAMLDEARKPSPTGRRHEMSHP